MQTYEMCRKSCPILHTSYMYEIQIFIQCLVLCSYDNIMTITNKIGILMLYAHGLLLNANPTYTFFSDSIVIIHPHLSASILFNFISSADSNLPVVNCKYFVTVS